MSENRADVCSDSWVRAIHQIHASSFPSGNPPGIFRESSGIRRSFKTYAQGFLRKPCAQDRAWSQPWAVRFRDASRICRENQHRQKCGRRANQQTFLYPAFLPENLPGTFRNPHLLTPNIEEKNKCSQHSRHRWALTKVLTHVS